MTNLILKWLRERALQKLLKPLHADVALVAVHSQSLGSLSDEALKNRLAAIRAERAPAPAEKPGALVAEVFAIVREAAIRTLGVTPYDTQVLAGMALYYGFIAEMGTGEGKTLAAPFAAAAQWALHGRTVHISTANEYLAQRDATMLLPLYRFLGMTVSVSLVAADAQVKRMAYTCAVVYSTHHVLAQDYLRDHLVRAGVAPRMRALGAVIIDEADAALIDDARMPVVLSADMPVQQGMYEKLNELAAQFKRTADEHGDGDFWVDGKDRTCVLTEQGYERATQGLLASGLLGADVELYDDDHQALLLKLVFALCAHHQLFKGQHYVVQDDAIVLIDENTGRLNPGRRWDSGLQQALEAKEGVSLSPEALTMARITLQHFFKQYPSMSGMTGTAMDDAEELSQVYGVPVLPIPLNKPSQRVDEPDRFYRTAAQKLNAVLDDIQRAHGAGQPVLIGTASVGQSNELSARLTALGLAHEVLNASQNHREAEIIAGAGRPGAITVSTNMAGRGVDIVLGGSMQLEAHQWAVEQGHAGWEEFKAASMGDGLLEAKLQGARAYLQRKVVQAGIDVRAAGGLRIIGLERYESRRMDRQLRGRCARQGDPGQTCFYLSLEDTLVENFAGERIRGILSMLDVKQGDEFEASLVKKTVDSAQKEVEGRSQAARRQLMEHENVLESQRRVVYELRTALLTESDLGQIIKNLVSDEGARLAKLYLTEPDFPETWQLAELRVHLSKMGVHLMESDAALLERDHDLLVEQIITQMQVHRELRLEQVEPELRTLYQRTFCVDALDRLWMQHLSALETMRRGIHLRQHAKVDPRQAYAKEAFQSFSNMLDDLKHEQVRQALTWVAAPAVTPENPHSEAAAQPAE
jgi:preprotein translocase subunit SecA